MNDEEKKFEIKKNMEKYFNMKVFEKLSEEENLNAVEYYKKYLAFMPKFVVEAIEESESDNITLERSHNFKYSIGDKVIDISGLFLNEDEL